MVMTEDEKKLTAYHEAGHAIVGLNVPQHDPIHKATIIPRGRALGLVLSLARTGSAVGQLHEVHVENRDGDGRTCGRRADVRERECHVWCVV